MDHLSSNSVSTNSSGTQTANRGYYAYGVTRSSSGTLPTDRTFTGQKQDATGLLYLNARYYDPSLGQFLSPDTLVPDAGQVLDYNRYLYVRGNPLKYTDPTGHCATTVLRMHLTAIAIPTAGGMLIRFSMYGMKNRRMATSMATGSDGLRVKMCSER